MTPKEDACSSRWGRSAEPTGQGRPGESVLKAVGESGWEAGVSMALSSHNSRVAGLTNRHLYSNHSVRLSVKRLLDTSSSIATNFICLEINRLKQEPVLNILPRARGLAVEWRMPVWTSCK